MSMLQIAFVIAALLPLAATILPLFRSSRWWIRVFDFPRLQTGTLALVVLVLLAVPRRPNTQLEIVLMVLLTLAVLYQFYEIRPYTRLARFQVLAARAGTPRISLLLSNVLMTNRNSAGLIAGVRQSRPDIFVAVEVDERWCRELSVLSSEYPHQLTLPLPNTYGMALFSRLELIEPRIRYLRDPTVPSMHTCVRIDGAEIELHFLHPRPPVPHERRDSDERDVELLRIAREVEKSPRPVIVAGDLNDVAWSHTTRLFQRISRLLDPRRGRGLFATFHSRNRLLRWPLDHLFHSDHFTLSRLQVLPDIGSDHFPIFVELAYEPAAQAVQEAPPADAADHAEATKKIATR